MANPRKRNRLTKRRINEITCLKSWDKVLFTLDKEDNESEDSDFPASIQDAADQLESNNKEDLSD